MRKPSRTPKSSTGSTSGRPRVKISNISTVQRPTPRIADSRSISVASSSRAAARRVGTTPSSAWRAMSRIAATLPPEKPQPRSAASSVASTIPGEGNATPG